MKLRVSRCVIYVRKLDEMIDFYHSVLGFAVGDRGPMDPTKPDGIEFPFLTQVETDHHQIAFAPMRGDGPSTTLDYIAFRVESFADVKRMTESLQVDDRATDIGTANHGNTWSVRGRKPSRPCTPDSLLKRLLGSRGLAPVRRRQATNR